jgi:hypothetical protein
MNSTVPAPDVVDGLGQLHGGFGHRRARSRVHAGAGASSMTF